MPSPFVAVRVEDADIQSQIEVVDSDVILACTAECSRTDCAVYVKYLGGTMMSVSAYYNRNGVLVVSDPNYAEYLTRCGTCGHEWEVKRDRNSKEVG